MNQVLIIAGKETEKESLVSLLDCYSACQILYASNSKQAKELIADQTPSLIIINAPLPMETAQDLALFMTNRTDAAIILLLPESYRNIKEYSVEEFGILTLFKPFKRSEFERTMKFANAFQNRFAKMQEKNRKLQKQLTEVRTIHRAKCLLIQHLHMTEPQAHRYIEKHAMDQRQSKMEVANNIIQSYNVES
ncbi:ANTAR domain-containing response regulator [Anaerotignum sp. MB30-C6]|uniref:ANTAR domain-containing response regulator n=1 Tax=Anaerotignum sp. MB30-C6 TaxID=3070814 RepID=UPI0027DAFAE9|nr:ANTAR domain-containing protein [Anaerotignum sp. MB30-C6]WMI80175.1 ANTAR domain-containing protein [Anaerotignum sp. MB30-C6]